MNIRIPVFTLFVLFVFSGCSRATPQADINFNYLFNNGQHNIQIQEGRVIITSDQGHRAVMTQEGTLTIENENIAVSPQAKDSLVQYVVTTQQMQAQGLAIAKHAGSFAAGILSDVFGGLLSGKNDKDIERTADQRAAEFKKSVLPICISAHNLEHLQDAIAAEVPAFKPYAVIQDKDVSDCQRDLTEKD